MAEHRKRVLIRRGLKRALPDRAPLGELLYCKDTNDLYIGVAHGIRQLTKGDGIYDGGYFTDTPDPDHASIADGGEF